MHGQTKIKIIFSIALWGTCTLWLYLQNERKWGSSFKLGGLTRLFLQKKNPTIGTNKKQVKASGDSNNSIVVGLYVHAFCVHLQLTFFCAGSGLCKH